MPSHKRHHKHRPSKSRRSSGSRGRRRSSSSSSSHRRRHHHGSDRKKHHHDYTPIKRRIADTQSSVRKRTRYLLKLHADMLKHASRRDRHNVMASVRREAHLPNAQLYRTDNGTRRLKSGIDRSVTLPRRILKEDHRQRSDMDDSSTSSSSSSSSTRESHSKDENLVEQQSSSFYTKVANWLRQTDENERKANPSLAHVEYYGWILVKIDADDDDDDTERYTMLPSFQPIIARIGERSNPRSTARSIFSSFRAERKAAGEGQRNMSTGVVLYSPVNKQAMAYLMTPQKASSAHGYGNVHIESKQLAKRLVKIPLESALEHVWEREG